jgi:hypothetical protein
MALTHEQLMQVDNGLISVKQAALNAGCSESTVRKYRKQRGPMSTEVWLETYTEGVEDLMVDEEQQQFRLLDPDWEQEDLGMPTPLVAMSDDPVPSFVENGLLVLGQSYLLSRCGFTPNGSRFACGRVADHKHRTHSGHSYSVDSSLVSSLD